MPSAEPPLLDFPDVPAFEAWLADQSDGAVGAWIRFAKGAERATSLDKSDAIGCALTHGWIDGQLGRGDGSVYKVRFTPRRQSSACSQVNRERVERLVAEGRMKPRGMAEVSRAKADGGWDAAYPPQGRATADVEWLASETAFRPPRKPRAARRQDRAAAFVSATTPFRGRSA